jgi:cytoskeleton protein RodZ
MSAVGSYLRNLRERQGVSLEELARVTRVLYRHLEALEADDLPALPAPVFTKGFIRAYCQMLGVAPDEALALYDPQSKEGHPAAPAPVPSPTPAPRVHAAAAEPGTPRGHGAVLVSFALLVVLGVALFAFTVAFQSGQEAGVGQRSPVASAPPPPPEASPEPSPVVEPPAPSPPPPAKPSVGAQPGGAPPSVATPAVAASAPAAPRAAATSASSYRLVARTTETTWMRVRTEDGRTIEETIPANEVREWVSNYPFVLSIGNAGGVILELNGRPIPRLGASGAVITRLVLPSEQP